MFLLTVLVQNLLPEYNCDVAVGAALIGAIGSLAGAAMSGAANSDNAHINEMNNYYNSIEAEKARKFQEHMWEREADYNSASSQVRRYSEAGLNPYLMMNNGSAGSVSGASSASQAQAAPPLAMDAGVYSNFGAQLGRAAQMLYEESQSNAMVQNLQSQKEVNTAQAYQLLSNIDWGKTTSEYRRWMRETGLQRAQLDYDTNRQNLENLRWTNKIQRAQRTDLLLSNKSKRILNKYLDQSEQLRLNVMASQYYDMMAAGHLKYQQCKESIAKQILYSKQGTWYDSMSNKNNLDYRNALALADDYISAMSTQYESQTAYNMGFGQKAQEAGRRDAESKSFKSLIDRWNYNKRYYEEGLRTIGVVGNAVGSVTR